MANAKSEEKKFLELLDRLMAGEIIPPSEIPDENMRADLKFASTRLVSKDGPSEQYRAQLRQRLLSKLAADRAEVSRRPFWSRPVWIAAATAAFAVMAVAAWWLAGSSTTMQVAAPSATLPAGDYAVNFPDRIAPAGAVFRAATPLADQPSTAIVYEISVPDITVDRVAEIARDLGMSGQPAYSQDKSQITVADSTGGKERRLAVSPTTGAVEYKFTDASVLKPKAGPVLPSKQEAAQISYAALQQAGLLPYGYDSGSKLEEFAVVTGGGSYPVMAGEGKAGFSGTQYLEVDIPLIVSGLQAAGPGSKAEVKIGSGGEVIGFSTYIRDFKPKYSVQTISAKSAYQVLASGGGSIDIPLNASEVVVDKVGLKYWMGPSTEKQSLLLPVYELEGRTLDKTGRTIEEFKGWTKAIY